MGVSEIRKQLVLPCTECPVCGGGFSKALCKRVIVGRLETKPHQVPDHGNRRRGCGANQNRFEQGAGVRCCRTGHCRHDKRILRVARHDVGKCCCRRLSGHAPKLNANCMRTGAAGSLTSRKTAACSAGLVARRGSLIRTAFARTAGFRSRNAACKISVAPTACHPKCRGHSNARPVSQHLS